MGYGDQKGAQRPTQLVLSPFSFLFNLGQILETSPELGQSTFASDPALLVVQHQAPILPQSAQQCPF